MIFQCQRATRIVRIAGLIYLKGNMKKEKWSPKEIEFFRLRFNTINEVKLSLTKVSVKMKVSRQRAFQMEQAILRKSDARIRKQIVGN